VGNGDEQTGREVEEEGEAVTSGGGVCAEAGAGVGAPAGEVFSLRRDGEGS
jgi:hypothetical protein